MSGQVIKILFYAINGTGLGHLSRLLNIARELELYLAALSIPNQIQFLTTSEGSEIAGDFPVYKIPSKTVIHRSRLSKSGYAAQAKLLISNLVAGFKPDILVLDTVPEGSFKEFLFLKDYAKKTAFVFRHMNEERQQSDNFQSHLRLYDQVIVPDKESSGDRYLLPARQGQDVHFVGPIHGYRGDETSSVGFAGDGEWSRFDRERVRQYFAIPEHRRLIYVSAGGGGDCGATRDLQTIIDTLCLAEENHLIVGYGPLYQGFRVYRDNVIALSEPGISRYFPGFDLAISAAGYNSYNELLAACVPTLFYPQEKGWDCQRERIKKGVERGWHDALWSVDPTLIQSKVAAVLDVDRRAEIIARLRVRGAASGASGAAKALLLLHSSLARSVISGRDVYFVHALRGLAKTSLTAPFNVVLQASLALETGLLTEQQLNDFKDMGRWQPDDSHWSDRAQRFLNRGCQLHRWYKALDWRLEELLRYLKVCYSGLQKQDWRTSHHQVEDIFETLLQHLDEKTAGLFLRSSRQLLFKEQLYEFLEQVVEHIDLNQNIDLIQDIIDFSATCDCEKLHSSELFQRMGVPEGELIHGNDER